MKKNKIIYILVVLIFSGCTSLNKMDNSKVYIVEITPKLFNEYYLITAILGNDSIYIITPKIKNDSCEFKLIENKAFNISLSEIDSNVSATNNIQSLNAVVEYRNKEIWRNGKITTKVYSSPNLKGLCLIK
jgi:hypothetical protein